MRQSRQRLIFIQLPQLDNDTSGAHEHLAMAATLLAHATDRCRQEHGVQVRPAPLEVRSGDDHRLATSLISARPDFLGVTLTLWNIERSLSILSTLKAALPNLRILAGGPEVARDNRLLCAQGVIDLLVIGEGESVIGGCLAALQQDGMPAPYTTTARRVNGRYVWGRGSPPACRPGDGPACGPDRHGMAYLEASRGCPFRCAYCAYNQRRTTLCVVPAPEVIAKVEALRDRGAREIRFVDPTFNSHPQFEELLKRLRALNRRGTLRFFAELHPERITPGQASLLAKAGFREIEVGMQSRDQQVLRAIHRPTRQDRLDRGIRCLAAAGLELTIDVMGGLPHQGLDDIRHSIEWAAAIAGARVQFLHTLLLPGTELRRQWGQSLHAQSRPPYRVTHTHWLPPAAFRQADEFAASVRGEPLDTPTPCFIGPRLPGLFADKVRISVNTDDALKPITGGSNRRAVIFEGHDLMGARTTIEAAIRHCIQREPHILWQFVLSPMREEPLDLLDGLLTVLRRAPRHTLDNMAMARSPRQRTARRLFVQLAPGRRYDPSWRAAVADLLADSFH